MLINVKTIHRWVYEVVAICVVCWRVAIWSACIHKNIISGFLGAMFGKLQLPRIGALDCAINMECVFVLKVLGMHRSFLVSIIEPWGFCLGYLMGTFR
jgi:hypothetical protein